MDKQPVTRVGGDLSSALQGKYKIDPKAVIKEAWLLTLLQRKIINLSLLFMLFFGVAVTLLVSELFGGLEQVQKSPEAYLFLNLVLTIVLSPFITSVEMCGLFGAIRSKPNNMRILFSFIPKISGLALASLIATFAVSLGLQLIIPGIYLLVALSLIFPLIIQKGLSPLKAIKISIQCTRFQWFQMFWVYLFMMNLLVIACLPYYLLAATNPLIGLLILFFALSYIAPMYYYAKGIIYREMFGLELSEAAKADSHSDTFSA